MPRLRRLMAAVACFVLAAMILAPVALATTSSGTESGGAGLGGQGFYGETNDKVITNWMFLVIIFFPTIIVLFSLIQWRLDKRKHDRMDAAKRRAASVDWRGGW